jgi:hypothetical protein
MAVVSSTMIFFNEGIAKEILFADKTIRGLRLKVVKGGGPNVGPSEIEVFER